MAEAVVDVLELVEIEKQQAHHETASLGRLQGALQTFREEVSIRQPRQGVVVGKRLNLLLCSLLIGEIPNQTDVGSLAIIFLHRVHNDLDREDASVAAPCLNLPGPAEDLGFHKSRPSHVLVVALGVREEHQDRHVLSDRLFRTEPEDSGRGRVYRFDPAVRVDRDDALCHILDDGTHVCLSLHQLRRELLQLGRIRPDCGQRFQDTVVHTGDLPHLGVRLGAGEVAFATVEIHFREKIDQLGLGAVLTHIRPHPFVFWQRAPTAPPFSAT